MGSTPLALASAAALFTFSRGECVHCAVPWIRPLSCAQVACSAVPALLWNSFHPWATGILHHSGRLCVGQGPVVVIGSRCWGSNRGVSVHGPICTVLSASLATPRSMEAAASILFFPELFLCQGVSIIQWLSKKDFWEEGWVDLSFTVMLRERYGASGG